MHPPLFALAQIAISPRAFDNTVYDNGPRVPSIQMVVSDQGAVLNVNGAGHIATDAVAAAIPEMKAFNESLSDFMKRSVAIIDEVNPKHVSERLKKLAVDRLSQPYQDAGRGARRYAENHTLNKEKFSNLGPVNDPWFEQSVFGSYRQSDTAARINLIHNGPIQNVIAVLRHGKEMAELNDDLYDVAISRVRMFNLSNSDAVKTSHTKKPSYSDPLARGVDAVAVANFTEQAVEAWRNKDSIVDQCRHELQTVCAVIGAMIDLKPDETYALLTGDADAT